MLKVIVKHFISGTKFVFWGSEKEILRDLLDIYPKAKGLSLKKAVEEINDSGIAEVEISTQILPPTQHILPENYLTHEEEEPDRRGN
jgi:hypothetical protein